MNHWLVKSEPFKYSWNQFEKEGKTFWDGVRNYQARNNLRAMKNNDLVLFYHSNEGKEIVGIAKVVNEWYQDPTTNDTNWCVVDLVPEAKLNIPVSLEIIKNDDILKEMALVRQGRLSVMPVTPLQFDRVLKLGEMK
jgi:predicted RNA-binding protein with PUA-like domain